MTTEVEANRQGGVMSPGAVRHLGAGLVVFAFLAAAPLGHAEETVQVSVLAILATERDDKIDPKLVCIAREVQKTHKKLTGFQMVKMTRKSLAVGAKETFELVGDQKATVTVKQGADEKNRVEVKVAPPRMGEITYDTCCGKFLPIVTPYRTKNKDLLIIAVRVQPCHEK
jgi:hypothetical protein